MSINWEKSAVLNDMSVEVLRNWLDRYPKSNKMIIAICDNCDKEREVHFHIHSDLCLSCAKKQQHKHDKTIARRISIGQKRYFENPDAREKMSMRTKERYDKMSDPGSEICKHHYLYDHNDLSLNTVQITRRDHMRLHQLLKKLGYKIPHIRR